MWKTFVVGKFSTTEVRAVRFPRLATDSDPEVRNRFFTNLKNCFCHLSNLSSVHFN